MQDSIKLRIALTKACNLFCKNCFNEWQLERNASFATEDTILNSVSNIKQHINSIKLTGGEPFLHKDLGSITHKLLDRAPVSITTNGLLLKKRAPDIPTGVPITVSVYGLDAKTFTSYTQTGVKVFDRFVDQIQYVGHDTSHQYSINTIIGSHDEWNIKEYIDFACVHGFKKLRFLTQLDPTSKNPAYYANLSIVTDFFETSNAERVSSDDPSLIRTNHGNLIIEMVRQYGEFDELTQKEHGFVWMDYKGKLYTHADTSVFNMNGFLAADNALQ
jgi:molybdenum cofactor biosynthesis enzyme MoaA